MILIVCKLDIIDLHLGLKGRVDPVWRPKWLIGIPR